MNYHEMIWNKPVIVSVVFVLVGLSFLNFRFWWASVAVLAINFVLYIDNLPRLANHSNLELFACMIFIFVLLRKIYNPAFTIPPVLVSWLFRVSLVTVYFYTGFHKLNTDFFNPCVSCVNQINEQLYANFTGNRIQLSAEFSRFFQYSTIFIEMILPFGLLWHKSRNLTTATMLFFHFYLAFSVFADFEAFALFMLIGCMIDFNQKTIDKKILMSFKVYQFLVLLVIFIKPIMHWIIRNMSIVDFIHGIIFNIGILIFFITFIKNNQTKEDRISRKQLVFPLVFIVLISMWTLKAYVGLGNSANLTMFSNLLTEKSRSNHLLIDTQKTKIFDFEEDNVLILKTHDTLKKHKLENYKIPISEFRYVSRIYSERFPDVKLNFTILYKNDTIVIPDLKNSEYMTTKWWYQYINFRKIQAEGPNKCIW